MVTRGARNLIFLSRAGVSGQEVAEFVAKLEYLGVFITIVQGDVSSLTDVERAVAAAKTPIKGVVQGALTLKVKLLGILRDYISGLIQTLQDSFLHSMTLEDFNATTKPRIEGTINLDKALGNHQLDFFLMWSSWTKMMGSASQANYMASSAFMNAFAVNRRRAGRPATSLTLGHILDVGILSLHLDWQQNVLRMGMYGNSEQEFLQYCETAIATPNTATDQLPGVEEGHLLAGFEAKGLYANRKRYSVEDMPWHSDPRFSFLLQSFRHHTLETTNLNNINVTNNDDDDDELLLTRLRKRVAKALYIAADDIDISKPINSYGIDSMVAAEIRNWLFQTLGVKVSLLNLLHPAMTVEKLAKETETSLELRAREEN